MHGLFHNIPIVILHFDHYLLYCGLHSNDPFTTGSCYDLFTTGSCYDLFTTGSCYDSFSNDPFTTGSCYNVATQ